MSKSQRDKGARVEREITNLFADALGLCVRRNLSQSRDGGYDFHVAGRHKFEVKGRKSFAVSAHLRQIEAALHLGDKGYVVLREDGDTEPMVLMRVRDFLPIFSGEIRGHK